MNIVNQSKKRKLSLVRLLETRPNELYNTIRDEETRIQMLCAEIRAALEDGADVNEERKGKHPLQTAIAYSAKVPVISILIDAGADVNARDKYGCTALHEALKKFDHFEIAKLLLAAGADVNAQDKEGRTPLIELIVNDQVWLGFTKHSYEDFFSLLHDAGADISLCDNKGKSPLHFAINTEESDMALILLEAGADPNARDCYGTTPIMRAVEWSPSDEGDSLDTICMHIRQLLEYGADISAKDDSGFTALDYARMHHAPMKLVRLIKNNLR